MTDHSIQTLAEQISSARNWHDDPGGTILLAAHSADVSMGTFEAPFDEGLVGMTLGQWQFERVKRMILAALNESIADN